MPRKKVDWRVRGETYHLGERTLIVGVLNVTPDSPFDGGRYQDPDRAFVRAVELADQGADVVEIGAESLQAGSERISEAEELRRLVPVLKRLRGRIPVPLCVETWKAAVAEKALSLGVEIIKDPTGLTLDAGLARIVSQHDAGLVLQHMRGTPDQWPKLPAMQDPAGISAAELSAAVHRGIRAGVLKERIAIDPGLGIGKRKEQNAEIIARLDKLAALAFPLQVSPTGKPFVTSPQLDVSLPIATAIAVAAVLAGAHILRVHDVAGIRPAVLAADALLRF
jgi:dihydropteroate synthase